VQDDGCVQVDESWYAARPARIGTDVLVRVYEKELEIRDIHTLALIRRHNLTLKKGDVVLPDRERIFNPSRQTREIVGISTVTFGSKNEPTPFCSNEYLGVSRHPKVIGPSRCVSKNVTRLGRCLS